MIPDADRAEQVRDPAAAGGHRDRGHRLRRPTCPAVRYRACAGI